MDEKNSTEEEPQYVIVLATFHPTGGDGTPVPKFGEPMVLPEVRAALLQLGWREPEHVRLPWHGRDETDNHDVEVRELDADGHVPVLLRGTGTAYLSPAAARSMAAALLAAAERPQ